VKSILRRRPSPALVISCIALFMSLGGVSYGLARGSVDSREIRNNTITSSDIRNNTIRTFDIRNNSVRGFDIRNSTVQGRDVALNTLTGADISEKDLGQVPSAAAADRAASVDVLRTIPPTSLAEGAAPVTLLTQGSLTLTARCDPAGGNTSARLLVQTSEAASAAGGTVDVPSLDPGDGAMEIAAVADTPGSPRTVGGTPVFASAPSGRAFSGQIAMLAETDGSAGCQFHGHLVIDG
jgi:hypothetical protein